MRLIHRLLIICISINIGLVHLANAQMSEARLATYVEVDPAAAERAAGLLKSWAESASGAAGSQMFQVAQRIGRANHFVVIEIWDSIDSQAAYAESQDAMQLHAALEPLLISPLDIREHNDLMSARASEVGPGAMFVVTHVDVFRPFVDTTVESMDTLVAASRAEDGNAQFDIWVDIERANHMTVVEAWESAAARDRHVTATHTREFRASLVSSIGALYDERLYQVY